MGARETTCFIAECDDCGDEYEHDYTPHWPSAGEAIADAVDTGEWWASEDQKTLLCNDCRDKPHAVVPDKNDPEGCARCPHPVDEHEPVTSGVCQCSSFPMAGGAADCPNHVPGAVPVGA